MKKVSHRVFTLMALIQEATDIMLMRLAVKYYASQQDDEAVRIEKARKALFGVDNIITLDDFEVCPYGLIPAICVPIQNLESMQLTPQKHARPLLSTSAWNYYSFGADGEHTMRNNSEAYGRVWFRPRVMRDVTECDMTTNILGVNSEMPVYISPTARNGLGQPLVSLYW